MNKLTLVSKGLFGMLPRKSGRATIDGYNIRYTDERSFYYEYLDIFKKEIYRFDTNKKRPLIIDAGGCIGMATLYFKKTYPNSRIIVFEPDQNIYKILQQNMKINKISHIKLINAGIGKNNEEKVFYADESDGGSLIIKDVGLPTKVRVVRLNEYIKKEIDLLKMNIEGSEYDVIKQIEKKLYLIENIIIEYHCFSNLPQTLSEILKILNRNNFKYVVTEAASPKVPIPPKLESDYKYFNIIYAKQK